MLGNKNRRWTTKSSNFGELRASRGRSRSLHVRFAERLAHVTSPPSTVARGSGAAEFGALTESPRIREDTFFEKYREGTFDAMPTKPWPLCMDAYHTRHTSRSPSTRQPYPSVVLSQVALDAAPALAVCRLPSCAVVALFPDMSSLVCISNASVRRVAPL